jgi:hypothetical protein
MKNEKCKIKRRQSHVCFIFNFAFLIRKATRPLPQAVLTCFKHEEPDRQDKLKER